MGWQVAITEQADADLGNVVAFLARKSPTAAERIGLELVDLIFSLDQMPNRGAAMRKRPSLRKIAHRHYLVIYRVNDCAPAIRGAIRWNAPGLRRLRRSRRLLAPLNATHRHRITEIPLTRSRPRSSRLSPRSAGSP